MKRLLWADNAKAIGMILVVYGHTQGIDPVVKKYIYSCHLPLFFFISGYLVKRSVLSYEWHRYVSGNLNRIVIPYIFFWFVSYPLWVLNGIVKKTHTLSDVVALAKPFMGLIYGTDAFLISNDVLWYFTGWFSTTIIFYLIFKNKTLLKSILLMVSAVVGPCLPSIIGFRLPWNIEVALVATVFYGAGYMISQLSVDVDDLSEINKIFLSFILFVVFVFSVESNIPTNMSGMMYGNLLYYYFGAFSGVFLLILLSSFIPQNRIFKLIAENTIVIFPLHIVIFSIFTGVGVLFMGLDSEFNRNSSVACYIYTAGAIIVCLPVAFLVKNYIPRAIGMKPR